MRTSLLTGFTAAALAMLVSGCDRPQPTEPYLAADFPVPEAMSGPPVAAPTEARAVASAESQIDISWRDKSNNETGFEVHRSASVEGVFTLLATTKANVVTYGDRSVEPGAQYCYRVRAARLLSAGRSIYSTFSNTACVTPVLAAPSSAAAAAVSETQIDIGWQDNSTYETRVEVHSAATAGGNFTLRAMLDPQVTRYSDQGLEPGSQHCYKVRAVRVNGGSTIHSAYSNAACAKTPPGLPAPPSGAGARPSSSSTVTIFWTDNSSNEEQFRIERSIDGGLVWNLWGFAYADATTVDRLPAAAEQQVCYRVVAVNASGEAPSNAACTTPPARPTNFVVTADANTTVLTWNDNSAVEDGYQVRRFQTNCIGPVCNAFDPQCENYGICERTILVAALPANSTTYRGPYPDFEGHYYNVLYVVATKDGGNSDASDPRVPLYPLE